jgi:hypothetical protein
MRSCRILVTSVAVVFVAAGCGGGNGTSKVGVISTVVGGGQGGDGGPATSALLANPDAVTCDSHRNLYVVDQGFANVRKVNRKGTITTVAGTASGSSLFSGDGGPATTAKLNGPLSIALDPTGNLYIADSGNNRIRRVDNKGSSRRLSVMAKQVSQVMEARPPPRSSLIQKRSPSTRLEPSTSTTTTTAAYAASTERESSRRWQVQARQASLVMEAPRPRPN